MDTVATRAEPLVLVYHEHPEPPATLQASLQEAGFLPVAVGGADQVVEAFVAQRPDVVLLDPRPGSEEVRDTCRRIRRMHAGRQVPILVLCDGDDGDSLDAALRSGATDVLLRTTPDVLVVHRLRQLLRNVQVLHELAEVRGRLAHAQHLAHMGNWQWDLDSGLLTCSEEGYRILGLVPEYGSTSLEHLLKRVPRGEQERVRGWFQGQAQTTSPGTLEHTVLHEDGSHHIVFHQTEPCDPEGTAVHGLVHDVTAQRTAEQQLAYRSHHDSLTGLANREEFQVRVGEAIRRAQRRHRHAAILVMDLDRFKQINESLGHSAGDALLQGIARRVQAGVEDTLPDGLDPGTCVARLSGDEFAVLLADLVHVQDAAKVARRILDRMEAPFHVEAQEVYSTASIGIALCPVDHKEAESLLKCAEAAMYHAKEQGRNNLQFYSPSMNSMAFERLTLETSLRRALDRDEFVLHYQPKMDLRSGSLAGLEALIRWRHPDLGTVQPGQFIPLAEETGLILAIGDWALEEACRQTREWLDAGLPAVRVAVNLAAPQFRQENLVEHIAAIIDKTGLPTDLLELELTESMLMRDVDTAVRTLLQLKRRGVHLAVDDFGTGYSSLSYLKQFPIDSLKIDRSFIHDLIANPDDQSIATAIILMAHGLNLSVVAEGVESEEQLRFLRDHGCDQAQGYLFSPAVPREEVEALLQNGLESLSHPAPEAPATSPR